MRLTSPSGLTASFNSNGALRRLDCGGVTLNLFVGNELEGGPCNLWLRRRSERCAPIPLLGPKSGGLFRQRSAQILEGVGVVDGLNYAVALVLAAATRAWFWRVRIESERSEEIDLIWTQDVALAPYSAIRLNEHYVSHYVDHTPLRHARCGVVVASRQNQPVAGRHPWCVLGSLRAGLSYATDALDVYGLAARAGAPPAGLASGLPGRRLQHEHSMVAIQDAPVRLEPGRPVTLGFFGRFAPDHPAATSPNDLGIVDETLEAPEAVADLEPERRSTRRRPTRPASATLFTHAPLFAADDLLEPDLVGCFGAERRHEERDEEGRLLSFFCGDDRHVALKAKELIVQRPHGHILRTGETLTPDEYALTSTAWMSGVFHSMLTQGHVSINRFLSTTHSYLGLFRSHGQRVFVELDGEWRLLDAPSAFEIAPGACRWIYHCARHRIEVASEALHRPHAFALRIDVRAGDAARFLISHHVALNGDDGSVDGAAVWRREGDGVAIFAAEGSDVHLRFPDGCFYIAVERGGAIEQVGGDELLFLDGQSRGQPYVCLKTAPVRSVQLRIEGRLTPTIAADPPGVHARRAGDGELSGELSRVQGLSFAPPPDSMLACAARQLRDITPWFAHNALVHYLSPRGLEQYSGGGWGTRDVCQGPIELLLAFAQTAPVRDLLLRVFSAQNPDGDWPQWFMFFERERAIRASDSHGDIVFWPILALAQYLIASGDGGLLEEIVPFFADDAEAAPRASIWEHVQRAFQVIERRVIAGTTLAAYGHGDWNDSLQPADPALRERLCSAWTVTLHHQTLTTLARALRLIGREADAAPLEAHADAVREDFQRRLIVDDVLTGYALFEQGRVRYLLHPKDDVSGVRLSSLAMIHAILEDLFTPEQARVHLDLIERQLCGPDGLRLFDQPMPYRGGPQRLFQRAESAAFFGREIGLMYMHAHLRYAQALARLGEAERFFHALRQANPIGLRDLTPQATPRQANCYYSSSDAAFADRYAASAGYEQVRRGEIALDGGWRIYSSGAGIAMSLLVRRFLGVAQEHDALVVDPVMPPALSGLRAALLIYDRPVELVYEIRAPGCGVVSVDVNGVIQRLAYEPNPYRKGAARISRAELLEPMQLKRNVMRIVVGAP